MPKLRISKTKKSKKSIMRGGMIRSGTVVSNLPKRSKNNSKKNSKRVKKSIMRGGMIRSGTVVSNLPKRSKNSRRSNRRNNSKVNKLRKL